MNAIFFVAALALGAKVQAFGNFGVPHFPYSENYGGTCAWAGKDFHDVNYNVGFHCAMSTSPDSPAVTVADFELTAIVDGNYKSMKLSLRRGVFNTAWTSEGDTMKYNVTVRDEETAYNFCCEEEAWIDGGCGAIDVLRGREHEYGQDFNACLQTLGLIDADMQVMYNEACERDTGLAAPPPCVEQCYFYCFNSYIRPDPQYCNVESTIEKPEMACCLLDSCDMSCSQEVADFKPTLEGYCAAN